MKQSLMPNPKGNALREAHNLQNDHLRRMRPHDDAVEVLLARCESLEAAVVTLSERVEALEKPKGKRGK